MTIEPNTQGVEFADPVWEQAPEEDEEDYILFTYYLEMPFHRRSIRGALRRAGMSDKNARVNEVAKQWMWEWRAYQYQLDLRRKRLAKIRRIQIEAQDTLIDGLVEAAETLIAGLETNDDGAKAARVRIMAATTILNMGGIDKAELVPLDVEEAATAEVEEVVVIEGDDEMLEAMAEWEEE